MARCCDRWRTDELQHEPGGGWEATGILRRTDTQGREPCRTASCPVVKVRSCHKHQDGKDAWSCGSNRAASYRRRGDRVTDGASSSTAAMHTPCPLWVKSGHDG